jgi:hypothetical protein
VFDGDAHRRAGALLAVIGVTRAGCIYPSGVSFAELVREQVDEPSLDRMETRVCVDRAPWNILWAAPFHPPRSYVVYEAESPADCRGAPELR